MSPRELNKYSNTFGSFTKEFKESLDQIVNAIYPIGITNYSTNTYNKRKVKSRDFGIFKKAKMAEMNTSNTGFEKVIE